MKLIDDVDKKINQLKKDDYDKYVELENQFLIENEKSRINSPVTAKQIDFLIENLHDEFEKFPEIEEGFKRNKKLIELSKQTIPENLWNEVLTKYENYEIIKPNFKRINLFLHRNGLRKLQDKIKQFF